MGKVDENKQQKEDALFRSAYNLFMSKGISKTSIHDIVQDAGVAKGTFYLYFKDKFEIRDRLIARTAEKLFKAANTELKKVNVPKFEDKIIFIVDYVLEQMKKNKAVLRFVSKNLSWGVFRAAIEQKEEATGVKTCWRSCWRNVRMCILKRRIRCCFSLLNWQVLPRTARYWTMIP